MENFNFSSRQTEAWQALADPKTNTVLYGGAKGGGKSFFGVRWVFLWTLELIKKYKILPSKYPPPVGFLGRKQSVDFTDTTLETWKVAIPEQYYELRQAEKEITICKALKLQYGGFDDRNTVKKFNSAEYCFAFIDQAEEISRDDYGLIKGTLRRKLNEQAVDYKILMTANPADCWLKDSFIDNIGKGNRFIQALPKDNPFLPATYINTLRDAFGHRPELIKAYLEGNWELLSENNIVIRATWVSASIEKVLHNVFTDVIISCDPARFGDDETIIYAMRGGMVIDEMIYGQKSTMETAGYCVLMMRKYNAKYVVVDSVGVGAGVVDRLKELDINVIEVNFASKPSGEIEQGKYFNLRAEVYWQAAEMFSSGLVSITNDKTLRSQLSHVRYMIGSGGRIKIESKDEIKKRLGGSSPDRADALVMGLWAQKFLGVRQYDFARRDEYRDKLERELNPLYLDTFSGFARSDYDV